MALYAFPINNNYDSHCANVCADVNYHENSLLLLLLFFCYSPTSYTPIITCITHYQETPREIAREDNILLSYITHIVMKYTFYKKYNV